MGQLDQGQPGKGKIWLFYSIQPFLVPTPQCLLAPHGVDNAAFRAVGCILQDPPALGVRYLHLESVAVGVLFGLVFAPTAAAATVGIVVFVQGDNLF